MCHNNLHPTIYLQILVISKLLSLSGPVWLLDLISEDTRFATQDLDNDFTHKTLAPLIAKKYKQTSQYL